MRPILFTDGLIHTMESEEAVASAMLVENGRIQILDPTPEQAKGAGLSPWQADMSIRA